MAAAPTGCSSPGFVTRPTPSPPSISMPEAIFSTCAAIRCPLVTSISSPPSLTTAAYAAPPTRRHSSSATSTTRPLGVSSRTLSGAVPVSSNRAAPAAASAAQVPVV